MDPIKVEEITKDGHTYIRETYANGTIVEYMKVDPPVDPDPSDQPVDQQAMLESMAVNLEYLVALSELGGNA